MNHQHSDREIREYFLKQAAALDESGERLSFDGERERVILRELIAEGLIRATDGQGVITIHGIRDAGSRALRESKWPGNLFRWIRWVLPFVWIGLGWILGILTSLESVRSRLNRMVEQWFQ